MGDKSTMISYSTTSKLLALCFLLILNTVAVDFELTDSALAQDAPVDFSSSVSDDAFGSIGNQPVIKTEVGLQKLPDMLMETSKSLLLTDGEEANCANPSPAHKTSRRSSRRIRKRLRQDFCSPQDHEKLRPARPSKPETNGTPAGQGGKAGVERPQGSIGGSNEFIHDPILNLEETRLFGEPNQALCPDMDKKVPVCTPYDQELRSPASVLVPSRFCTSILFFSSLLPALISLSLAPESFSRETAELKKFGFGEFLLIVSSQGDLMTGAPKWREYGKICGAAISLIFAVQLRGNRLSW